MTSGRERQAHGQCETGGSVRGKGREGRTAVRRVRLGCAARHVRRAARAGSCRAVDRPVVAVKGTDRAVIGMPRFSVTSQED